MNTVGICDMEPVAIEGLQSLLAARGELRVVAANHLLADGMAAIRETEPALVILDKGFGLQLVIESVRELRLEIPDARIIVWGAAISEAEGLRLLHAGALGVVRKTAALNTLLHCIDNVNAGMTWIEDGLIQIPEAPVRTGNAQLTARELQVMDLVERGMTNKDIAHRLGIQTGTVKIHLKHIFEKTGIRGRYGLALCGLKEKGLLLAPEYV